MNQNNPSRVSYGLRAAVITDQLWGETPNLLGKG